MLRLTENTATSVLQPLSTAVLSLEAQGGNIELTRTQLEQSACSALSELSECLPNEAVRPEKLLVPVPMDIAQQIVQWRAPHSLPPELSTENAQVLHVGADFLRAPSLLAELKHVWPRRRELREALSQVPSANRDEKVAQAHLGLASALSQHRGQQALAQQHIEQALVADPSGRTAVDYFLKQLKEAPNPRILLASLSAQLDLCAWPIGAASIARLRTTESQACREALCPSDALAFLGREPEALATLHTGNWARQNFSEAAIKREIRLSINGRKMVATAKYLVRKVPTDADAQLTLARAYNIALCHAGWVKARALSEIAAQLPNVDEPECLYQQAYACMRLGNIEEALGLLSTSGSDAPRVKILRAFATLHDRNVGACVQTLQDALATPEISDFERADCYFGLGMVKEAHGDADSALAYYQIAEGKNPQHPLAILRMAWCYSQKNDQTAALAHLSKLRQCTEVRRESAWMSAAVRYKSGNYLQSMQFFLWIEKHFGPEPDLLTSLAEAAWSGADKKTAANALCRLAIIQPDALQRAIAIVGEAAHRQGGPNARIAMVKSLRKVIKEAQLAYEEARAHCEKRPYGKGSDAVAAALARQEVNETTSGRGPAVLEAAATRFQASFGLWWPRPYDT